ncbi:PREDICTED: ligand-gated ion channel 4-like, partial [Priapulus caudatus]|uniref:Ligand-gated ion channel 4-like n=1 Tax=Priapulus caudatus TaxID=37621 RepID=A0ABM1EPK2_PRICU
LLGGGSMSREKNMEYKLSHYLMQDYDKTVRPAFHSHDPLNVTFGLALTQIIDLRQGQEHNTRQAPTPREEHKTNTNKHYNKTAKTILKQQHTEKLTIGDRRRADTGYTDAIVSTNAIVSHDGNVTWLAAAIFRSSCRINVRYFPFDEQNCMLQFASWTYDGFQMDLIKNSDEADLSNYVANGEWKLISLKEERKVMYYSCCSEPYPHVTYTIQLRRRPLYYVFNLVLPCVLITAVALLGFYMPSDSGEKVTLGITTLLSMTVFLMLVAESMPPTSEEIPLIGMYYGRDDIASLALLGPTRMTVYHASNIHHKACAQGRAHDYQPPQDAFPEKCSEMSTSIGTEPNGGLSTGSPRFGHRVRPQSSMDLFERQFIKVLNKVYQTIEKNEIRLAEQDRRDTIRLEWQQVALVVDRILLWVFILVTTIVSLVIIYSSPYTSFYGTDPDGSV